LNSSAGRLATRSPTAVFQEGEKKKLAEISAQRLTRVAVIATCHRKLTHCALRLALAYGRGPNRIQVAVSGDGEFKDASKCVRIPEVDVEPEKIKAVGLWLVVELMSTCYQEQEVEIDILSESRVQIGQWERVDD